MTLRKFVKKITTFILILALMLIGSGCGKFIKDNSPSDNNQPHGVENTLDFDFVNSDITSLAAQDHIKFTIEEDLCEILPDYYVDYVGTRYISQEYIEEFYYNSLNNVYFGYDYDEIVSAMQGINWTFTVDENGQTIVKEVKQSSSELVNIIKKVAIGTGVIVVCAVVSCVSGGVGAAPIACFFAGAAKGALIGAVSGAAISGAIGGSISGIKTKSWEGALNGALNSAADGFMWGAITGALVGGFNSAACFAGNTLVKTKSGYKPICEIEVGESVYSYNENNNIYDYQPVSKVIKRTSRDIVKVSVGDEAIVTTSNHPFYTNDGWVKAKDLSSDSFVFTKNGYRLVNFVELDILDENLWVYNLTVSHNHTYTVSTEDVVVHNACGDSAKLRQNLIDAGDKVPDYPNAAHHIIPSSDARYAQAAQARDKLVSLGIDINDANNGVFLSTSKNIVGTTYHRTLHTGQYYDKVNSLLSVAKTKAEAIDVLTYIKTALLNGTF